MEENVNILDWTAKSPDLTPVESLWSILSLDVYSHGMQSFDVEELKEATRSAWSKIKREVLVKLCR